MPEDELRRRLDGVSLELVLTAHPTEATRRTTCSRRTSRIAELLRGLDDPQLTAASASAIEDALAEEITILWQTDEVRHERPRVIDEIRHGLWFFEQSLLDAAERLLAAYRGPAPGRPGAAVVRHLDRRRPGRQPRRRRPRRSLAALERARSLALGRYRDEVRELAVALAIAPFAGRRLAGAG